MRDNLKTFLKIVETGSLSAASRELFAAQSTISGRLKRLEEELGFLLINREKGRKQIKLTLKGKEFIPIANRLLSDLNEIRRLSRDDLKYNVSFSCPESICSYMLKDLVGNIKSEGVINLNLTSLWNDLTYHKMEVMEADVGIVTRIYHTNSLHQYPLYKEKLILVYHLDYSSYADIKTVSKLNAENGIYLDWGDRFELWVRKHFETPDNFGIRIDTPSLIVHLLKKQYSWAVMPQSVFEDLAKTERVALIPIKDNLPVREVFLLIPSCSRLFSKKMVKEFCLQLVEYIKSRVAGVNQRDIMAILQDEIFVDL